MDEPEYFRSILEKKNHWGSPPTPPLVTSLSPLPTKRREEWSMSLEVWESPGTSSGISSAMPKKQLYSAVTPVVLLVCLRLFDVPLNKNMKYLRSSRVGGETWLGAVPRREAPMSSTCSDI